jgi:hypothetical protein
MASQKSVPGSLKAFLKEGVEAAECTICKEPFDNEHVVIQIKECGHVMGKICLEKWLQQNRSEGTCPICRGVLFTAKKTKKRDRQETSLAPARFNTHYGHCYNIERSTQNGFFGLLWKNIVTIDPQHVDLPHTPKDCVIRAFEELQFYGGDDTNTERQVLSPYIPQLRLFATTSSGPLTQLVVLLSRLSTFGGHDFMPTFAAWRAVLLFGSRSSDPTLNLPWIDFSWIGLREAAWTLGDDHANGRPGYDQWRWLYLFLWLMGIYRNTHLDINQPFTIHDVRRLLRVMDIGYPTEAGNERDTDTRLFLSASVYAVERSCLDADYGQLDRTQRLLHGHTELAQLKADVEGLWLEGLASGAADIAVGYPEHWWTGT